MTDPAVEAAQRGSEAWTDIDSVDIDELTYLVAHETLKPIKAEIENMRESIATTDVIDSDRSTAFRSGAQYALNRIAKHVYPSEAERGEGS